MAAQGLSLRVHRSVEALRSPHIRSNTHKRVILHKQLEVPRCSVPEGRGTCSGEASLVVNHMVLER